MREGSRWSLVQGCCSSSQGPYYKAPSPNTLPCMAVLSTVHENNLGVRTKYPLGSRPWDFLGSLTCPQSTASNLLEIMIWTLSQCLPHLLTQSRCPCLIGPADNLFPQISPLHQFSDGFKELANLAISQVFVFALCGNDAFSSLLHSKGSQEDY